MIVPRGTSPSTRTLHADIHGHIFLEIKVNQQDKTSVSSYATLMYDSSVVLLLA